ncbi:hypothetical protein N0V85_007815 [Neurospora sp. IMI 360204]|nr:hypothetical protein N0V85_007815 [Neurospora sp. IMI 360204]
MRLINTETLELHEFFESQAPPYVILSHTWEKDEITFREMVTKSRSTKAKAGYKKVQDTCSMAQRRGQQWAWIDTCCIDKSSSAELTESINSMYRWYQNAHECYAYLVDFAPGSLPQDELEICRWFTRGFTLQELIAPKTVLLFDRDWNVLGKKSDKDILKIINRITRISIDALLHRRPLGDCAIAERMLWASTRETTRPEDRAYCLLGIFEVNMPLIYGEGDNAFRRLQEEIIKRSTDSSIFAWGTPLNFQPAKNKKGLTEHPSIGLFASSPADFRETWEHMEKENPKFGFPARAGMYDIPDFVLTNRGLNMGANMIVGDTMLEESWGGPWGGPREGTFYNLYHIQMGGEDDLPEITSLIQQSHIPHDVLFPGRGLQSRHLLNKGPEYGLQKVFSGGSAHKSQRVTIGITSAITQPPAEFECALGRIRARRCYTVMLHATVEDDAEDVGNLTRCVPS